MTKVKDIFSKAGRNRCPARFSGSDKWNPNRPAQFTQEEFLEHIHEIEKGPFTPLDIANREFEEWKVEFLRNQKPDVPKHYLGFSVYRITDCRIEVLDIIHAASSMNRIKRTRRIKIE